MTGGPAGRGPSVPSCPSGPRGGGPAPPPQKHKKKERPSTKEISDYCDEVVKRLPVKLLVVDNVIEERYNEYMDGNLRIVFEKPE